MDRYLAGEYGVDLKDTSAYEKWRASHQPFHWFVEFYGIMQRGGFDVAIGNPPYVEYSKIRKEYTIRGYQTEGCGNLYAYVLERSFNTLSHKGALGLIVPLSFATTERMKELQTLSLRQKRPTWISCYDVYPCKLFEGSKQRLTILVQTACSKDTAIFTTKYNRWKPQERQSLLHTLSYWRSGYKNTFFSFPKLEGLVQEATFSKLLSFKAVPYIDRPTSPAFYVHRIPYNYGKAFDFVPYFWNEVDGVKKSEDYKPYSPVSTEDKGVILATLNSNLFFWWWYLLYEGYHCGRHEIAEFPVGVSAMNADTRRCLEKLATSLMLDYQNNKARKEAHYKATGKVVYDEFFPRLSKPIIDEIDGVLARHYGFTDEELDFIINYDIKYRMGRDGGGEDAD